MSKKVLAIISLVAVVGTLTGCGNQAVRDPWAFQVDVNGTTVWCVSTSRGGLDCDFEGATNG